MIKNKYTVFNKLMSYLFTFDIFVVEYKSTHINLYFYKYMLYTKKKIWFYIC